MQNDPRDPLDTILNVRPDSPTDIELKRQTPLTEKEKQEMQRRGRRLLFKKPWYTWIIVAFVIAMIVWTYTTYVFHFVIPWVFILGRYYGIAFFILFTAMTALVSYSYYMAVTTHPGLAPDAWALSEESVREFRRNETEAIERLRANVQTITQQEHDDHDSEEDTNESLLRDQTTPLSANSIEKTKSGKARCCIHCKQLKPDRTHHCRQCGVCVLKMDHHCWWFNNCIGYYNYKYFFLFVFWTSITTLFLTTTMSKSFVDIFKLNAYTVGITFSDVNIVACYFINFFFGLSLVFFVLYHLKLVLFGQTTLESIEKYDKLMDMHQFHPYDLGVTDNWKAVFGEKWYWWFLPTQRSVVGDGIHFRLNPQCT